MLKVLLLIIGSWVLITSCDDEDEHFENLEIDSNLVLTINETYRQGEISAPELRLRMETEEFYPCANFGIILKIPKHDSHLQVEVLNRWISSICALGFGPATTNILLSEDIEQLTIIHQDQKDRFVVSVAEESVSIRPEKTTFSSIDHETYYRTPEKSFAFHCRTSEEDSLFCSEFEQVLRDSLAVEAFEFQSGGDIPFIYLARNTKVKYFRYINDDELTLAGQLLDDFYIAKLKNKTGLFLSITGWNNVYFRNDEQLR